MTEIERRTRLVGWLEIIYADVQDLLHDDYIFLELQGIVEANPRFATTSDYFTQWIVSSFAQATAVGVRRQAKDRTDAVSLKRFLNEVLEHPELVSRVHYLSLYAGKKDWLKRLRCFKCSAKGYSSLVRLNDACSKG